MCDVDPEAILAAATRLCRSNRPVEVAWGHYALDELRRWLRPSPYAVSRGKDRLLVFTKFSQNSYTLS